MLADVEGVDVVGMPIESVAAKLWGAEGSLVQLEFERRRRDEASVSVPAPARVRVCACACPPACLREIVCECVR